MFTGIISLVGQVHLPATARGVFGVRMPHRQGMPALSIGESIAVDGVCLTVVAKRLVRVKKSYELTFELSSHTQKRTTLAALGQGSAVNLERSATVETLFGGHLVQGHVDQCATLTKKSSAKNDNATMMVFRYKPSATPRAVNNGSIAVNGVSLTIVSCTKTTITCCLIPHTIQATTFKTIKIGDRVNIEFDYIGTLVAQYIAPYMHNKKTAKK